MFSARASSALISGDAFHDYGSLVPELGMLTVVGASYDQWKLGARASSALISLNASLH